MTMWRATLRVAGSLMSLELQYKIKAALIKEGIDTVSLLLLLFTDSLQEHAFAWGGGEARGGFYKLFTCHHVHVAQQGSMSLDWEPTGEAESMRCATP